MTKAVIARAVPDQALRPSLAGGVTSRIPLSIPTPSSTRSLSVFPDPLVRIRLQCLTKIPANSRRRP
jgi:hypothetical protein